MKTDKYQIYKHKLLQSKVNLNYNTRNSALLRPPFERLKKFMISFFNDGVRVWNNLSNFVKSSNKIKEFKIKIKNWLLHNDIWILCLIDIIIFMLYKVLKCLSKSKIIILDFKKIFTIYSLVLYSILWFHLEQGIH